MVLNGPMKYRLLFIGLFICCALAASSQDEVKLPRNFAGAMVVLDATNISFTLGVEYERQLLQVKHFVLGVKADYLKRYRSGNVDINFSGGSEGFSDDYKISLAQLWATGYLFVSEKQYSGFFVSAAGGLTYSVAKRIQGSFGNERYSKLLSGVEFGTGLQYPLDAKSAIRVMFHLSFSGPQETPRGDRRSLSLMGLKLSLGF